MHILINFSALRWFEVVRWALSAPPLWLTWGIAVSLAVVCEHEVQNRSWPPAKESGRRTHSDRFWGRSSCPCTGTCVGVTDLASDCSAPSSQGTFVQARKKHALFSKGYHTRWQVNGFKRRLHSKHPARLYVGVLVSEHGFHSRMLAPEAPDRLCPHGECSSVTLWHPLYRF